MAEPTVPLSERVEYASPGWLAEVERFLNARAHLFSDQPLSLSMRLDNPPPHLWDDVSEPFGYTMRIARGSVVVEAQPDATADGFERGDYNAILPLLGTVFDEDTEASYRMDRELRILLRYFMRPLERYDDIDQAIVDRNPPAFSTLCGLDDPFGKSGDTGADFERLRYAANAGYGRTPLR